MADRPIIFSAPMVRALLGGRKTQTRRMLKPQPVARDVRPLGFLGTLNKFAFTLCDDGGANSTVLVPVVYQVGDRLWVREAHAMVPYTAYLHSEGVQMTANGGTHEAAIYREGFDRSTSGIRWRPSIYMPRWASRLTLIVTDVRVQRLQQISEEDAIAEGIDDEGPHYGRAEHVIAGGAPWSPFRLAFADLWNSLHGPDAWDANSWVCALTFTVHRRNIDHMGLR